MATRQEGKEALYGIPRKTKLYHTGFWIVAVFCFTFLVACGIGPSTSDPETASVGADSPISAEFQAFYDDNGGLRIFGHPLADPYIEVINNRLVQYYQKMRLEFNPALEEVTIFPLGDWAQPTSGNQLLASVPEEASGIDANDELPIIQDEFLAFYEAAQGQSLFGLPITPQLDEGGTRVQYFQNARLEWHPDAPLGYRVKVGSLGEAHYRLVGIFEDPGRNRPLDSAAVREDSVSANLWAPILYDGDQQVIFVDVETPEGQRPVANVTVELEIKYNGKSEVVTLSETDGAGHTQGILSLPEVEPGQKVQVIVTASAPGGATIGETTQSFRTWW